MVRRAQAIARVGAPYLLPGPDGISPPRESPVHHGPGSLSSSHRRIPSATLEQKGDFPVPFFLLVVLLVIAIVVLLLAVYFLVRRWL